MNSALYVASRSLVSLAKSGRAPKFFAKTTKNGTPANALIFSNLLGLFSILNYTAGPGKVFSYLTSLSGSATYIAWAVIGVTHVRFRRGWIAQGHRVEDLPFRALWYPYGTMFVIFINTFLVFISGYGVFVGGFDAVGFVINYIVIVVFVVLFCGWKILKRTKLVPLSEMDLTTGRRHFAETMEHNDVGTEKKQIPWYIKIKRLIFT
jgi:yeast amino acid transporter